MIDFIDDHRGAHGVQPICKVLPIAPSTYHAHVAGRRAPAKLSARAKRDALLKTEIRRVFEENFAVYGVRKVWRQLKREGFDVARCTASRLMPEMGLQGVIRGKSIKTTTSDKAAPCPLDHVNRRPGASLFCEGSRDLIAQGFDEIGQRSTLRRPNVDLGRHPGH
jgi:transposase InsO family protein